MSSLYTFLAIYAWGFTFISGISYPHRLIRLCTLYYLQQYLFVSLCDHTQRCRTKRNNPFPSAGVLQWPVTAAAVRSQRYMSHSYVFSNLIFMHSNWCHGKLIWKANCDLNSAMVDDHNVVVASATGSPALGLQANGIAIVWLTVPGDHHRSQDPIRIISSVARSRNARLSSDSFPRTFLMWPGLRWRKVWLVYRHISTKPSRQRTQQVLLDIVPLPLSIMVKGTWVK